MSYNSLSKVKDEDILDENKKYRSSSRWQECKENSEPYFVIEPDRVHEDRYHIIIDMYTIDVPGLELKKEIADKVYHTFVGAHVATLGEGVQFSDYEAGCDKAPNVRFDLYNVSLDTAKIIYKRLKLEVTDPSNWVVDDFGCIDAEKFPKKVRENSTIVPSKDKIVEDMVKKGANEEFAEYYAERVLN